MHIKYWVPLTAVIFSCVGAAAAKLVIPPARAQNVQRWEYFCLEGMTDRGSFVEKLNAAGREGWELTAAGAGSNSDFTNGWCFKRPLP